MLFESGCGWGYILFTPIKTVSIPRLELSAATVGVKLGKMLAGELTCKLHRVVYLDRLKQLQYCSF